MTSRMPEDKKTNTPAVVHPLDIIRADHLRMRDICSTLETLTSLDDVAASDLDLMRQFMAVGLPRHMADEENSLVPLMRKRCEQEDGIDRAIDSLLAGHAQTRIDLVDCLHQLDGTRRIDPVRLSRFAVNKRKHLVFEDAVLLPIAQARLLPEDLAHMLAEMQQRRVSHDRAE